MYDKDLLNRLHVEMIKLYNNDPKRIQHFCKVHSYAKLIGELEGLDSDTMFTLETAALTHDIGIRYCEQKYDGKCHGKLQELEGPAIAAELLASLGFDEAVSERVQFLIGHHHSYSKVDGIDFRILVEADFLVNNYEDEIPVEAARLVDKNVFRTKSGKMILHEMFDI